PGLACRNRDLRPAGGYPARDTVRAQQDRIISDLEEKLSQAPEQASVEFMYQDRAEVERELHAARLMLSEIPSVISGDDLKARTWNVLPYKRYRGADND